MTFILKTHDTIVGKFANLLRKPHVEWYLGKVKIIDSTWRCLLRRPWPCRGLSKSSWLRSLPWAAHLIYRYSCFYLFNFISLSLWLVEVTNRSILFWDKTCLLLLFFFFNLFRNIRYVSPHILNPLYLSLVIYIYIYIYIFLNDIFFYLKFIIVVYEK